MCAFCIPALPGPPRFTLFTPSFEGSLEGHPPSTLTDSIPVRENPQPTKFRIFFQATIPRRIVVLSEAKDLSTRTPTILRTFFQVPYTLNSFFSHSSKNCRGVPTFFPFWNSARANFEFRTSCFGSAEPQSPVTDHQSLSLLQSVLTSKDRVLPGFGRSYPPATPLESALTKISSVTPLECALTKKGRGVPVTVNYNLRIHSVALAGGLVDLA